MEISLENLSSSERNGSFSFYVESLTQGEVWISPVPIRVTGIGKGSAKLAIGVSEAGKQFGTVYVARLVFIGFSDIKKRKVLPRVYHGLELIGADINVTFGSDLDNRLRILLEF